MAEGGESMTLDRIIKAIDVKDNDKIEHYIYIIAKEN